MILLSAEKSFDARWGPKDDGDKRYTICLPIVTIGIDARSLIGDISGVGNYLRGVLTSDEFAFDAVGYSSSPDRGMFAVDSVAAKNVVSPGPVNQLLKSASPAWWMNVTLPRILRRDDVSCFLGPNFLKPVVCPSPSVVVVHDFVHRIHPETHSAAYRRYLRTLLPLSIRTADRIVVVSESTKDDLQRFYDLPERKLSVAYPAASPRFEPRELPLAEHRRLRREYGLPEEFVLYVGNIEPRKNLSTLVRSIRTLPADDRLPLVVVGQEHVPDPEFQAVLSEDWADGLVYLPGYIPDDDLPLLYNAASVFAYPSIYEGFGIPPLEAMQSGTPVVTSDRSSLPEVVGDAGLTADPTDTDAIATALAQLLDEETARDYRRRGVARAQEFSWDTTARIVSGAIESAMGGV